MNLLSLDPGKCTGWSLWIVRDDAPIDLIDYGQVSGGVDGFVDWWRKMQQGGLSWDTVVSESFRLDGRTPSPDLTPKLIEGALAVLWPRSVIYQANTYKVHAPDDLLKRAGLWQKGMPHANDAIRHAIAWAKLSGHLPTIKWLWPMPAELAD